MTKPRLVTTFAGRKTATVSSGDIDFGHITVAGIIDMAGGSYGPGVVLSGAKAGFCKSPVCLVCLSAFLQINEKFSKLWPDAVFHATPAGSVTAEIFYDFLLRCWLEKLDPETE